MGNMLKAGKHEPYSVENKFLFTRKQSYVLPKIYIFA